MPVPCTRSNEDTRSSYLMLQHGPDVVGIISANLKRRIRPIAIETLAAIECSIEHLLTFYSKQSHNMSSSQKSFRGVLSPPILIINSDPSFICSVPFTSMKNLACSLDLFLKWRIYTEIYVGPVHQDCCKFHP